MQNSPAEPELVRNSKGKLYQACSARNQCAQGTVSPEHCEAVRHHRNRLKLIRHHPGVLRRPRSFSVHQEVQANSRKGRKTYHPINFASAALPEQPQGQGHPLRLEAAEYTVSPRVREDQRLRPVQNYRGRPNKAGAYFAGSGHVLVSSARVLPDGGPDPEDIPQSGCLEHGGDLI